MTIAFWKPEEFTTWMEETATYTITGDVITITDDEGEKTDLVFKDRNLYLQESFTYEGYPMAVNILMKK